MTLGTGIHIHEWSTVRKARPDVHARLRKEVIIPNPEYLAARRAGKRGWGIDRELRCYDWDRQSDIMTLPIGLLGLVMNLLGDRVEILDKRTVRPTSPMASHIVLREYQVPAVEALEAALRAMGVALLEAETGSGKTEMGIEVISRLGQRTLWITHTKELADQARERMTARLDIDPSSIGMIGDGRDDEGKITIGMVQTLSRLDLGIRKNHFGCVVVDEVHHQPAESWRSVVGALAPRYRFGVTGSLERQDGLERITHLYFGPTTYTIAGGAAATGTLVPDLRTLRITSKSEAWDEFLKAEETYKKAMEAYTSGQIKRKPKKPTMPFGKILASLLDDHERNCQITELLGRIAPGRKTLVLSQRVEHCETLAKMLRTMAPSLNIDVIHGGQSAGQRAEILDAARSGRLDVLFSVAIAKEGLDVPILDQLVFVAGGKDPTYIKQAVGRIRRLAPGKTRCTVWDVVDTSIGVMQAQYWKRMRVYREIGMVRRAAG